MCGRPMSRARRKLGLTLCSVACHKREAGPGPTEDEIREIVDQILAGRKPEGIVVMLSPDSGEDEE